MSDERNSVIGDNSDMKRLDVHAYENIASLGRPLQPPTSTTTSAGVKKKPKPGPKPHVPNLPQAHKANPTNPRVPPPVSGKPRAQPRTSKSEITMQNRVVAGRSAVPNGDITVQENTDNSDPLYDVAMPVQSVHVRSGPSSENTQTVQMSEEPLYEEAIPVPVSDRKSFSETAACGQSARLPASEKDAGFRSKSGRVDPTYTEAVAVVPGRLSLEEKFHLMSANASAAPDYEEAAAVCPGKVNDYEEAIPVSSANYQDDDAVYEEAMPVNSRHLEQDDEDIYEEAIPVLKDNANDIVVSF